MKVTVERAELLKSLGHVHRVVERRNTIPILANVLIRADRSALSLKATDLDLEVIESIAAEVSPAGSTTLPAHIFYEIVRKLPEGSQVVLESSSDRAALAIRAGRSRFTLQTLPESDFPDLAAGDMTHKFKLVAGDIKRLIDKTQFAISASRSSMRRCTSPTVLRGTMMPGMPSEPDGASISARAKRWPSVATERSFSSPLLSMVWR